MSFEKKTFNWIYFILEEFVNLIDLTDGSPSYKMCVVRDISPKGVTNKMFDTIYCYLVCVQSDSEFIASVIGMEMFRCV